MTQVVLVLVLISAFWYQFGQSYVLLGLFHKDHPGKCPLEEVVLNPPLPKLNVRSILPGEEIGTEYDESKDHCRKLSCTVWENRKGEGYRLENTGCAVITKRPSNCSVYAVEDNRLPWPDCCYFHICPRVVKDEL